MRPAPGDYILQRLQGECYTLAMSKAGEDYLMNPPPGSAAARAVEFGIDLTLTVENLRLTPEQRIRQLDTTLPGLRNCGRPRNVWAALNLHMSQLSQELQYRIEKQARLLGSCNE